MLKVIDISFNDQSIEWEPEDPSDFEEWITINVGEQGAGNWYQIHICTPKSIKSFDSKRHVFMVDQWLGLDNLVSQLNDFIKSKLDSNFKDDPYLHLSNFWQWEYGK